MAICARMWIFGALRKVSLEAEREFQNSSGTGHMQGEGVLPLAASLERPSRAWAGVSPAPCLS